MIIIDALCLGGYHLDHQKTMNFAHFSMHVGKNMAPAAVHMHSEMQFDSVFVPVSLQKRLTFQIFTFFMFFTPLKTLSTELSDPARLSAALPVRHGALYQG